MSEFEHLIKEGAAVSKEAASDSEFIGKPDPAAEIDLDKEAEKNTVNLLIGIDASVKYFWPFVQVADPRYDKGVKRLKPLVRKYGSGELPGWMLFLKKYQDEFLAGAWCAGFAIEVKRQIKVEAERVAAEEAKQKEDDLDKTTGAGDA